MPRFLPSAIAVVALTAAPSLLAQDRAAAAVNEVIDAVDAHRAAHERAIIEDFAELLAIPNVASKLPDMNRNAEHIERMLESRGFTTQILQAGGSPYIYAELPARGAAETVLIYAHYDGQPVLEEDWTYAPFSPTLLNAPLQAGGRPVEIGGVDAAMDPEWRLYGRSAGDDKLPIIAIVHALDALASNDIPLNVNLKLLLDGEEERGSPTLARVLDEHGDLLGADLMLFCDGPMHQSRRPQLVFGSRGDMVADVTAYGASRPLHSGHYGNWAPNPIMQLAYLLTSMRAESGHILIDGYYDDVAPLTEQERQAITAMPDISRALENELAIHTPEGDGARLEELIALPAINARGFVAGGVGERGANVIRPSATVSLDLRLVPNQLPERVRERIETHIAAQGFFVVHEDPTPQTLREHEKVVKVDWRGGATPPMRTSLEDPAVRALIRLMQSVSSDLLLTPILGGTLPIYDFGTRFATPIVILPLANHDNNQHAENENVRLQNVWDAISVFGAIFAAYGPP